VIGGLAGVAVGGLAQGAAGTLNVNGVAGGWPALLLGAGVTAAVIAVLARSATARWRDVPIGIAVGLMVIGLLDLAELVRGIDEAMVGGPLGGFGRVVAPGSAVALLAGLITRRHVDGDSGWLHGVRMTPRYHLARLGGIAVAAGWALLVTQGQGFAIRTVDALGLVAVAVLVTGLSSSSLTDAPDRPGRATVAAFAALVVLVGVDTALVVIGQLGSMWSDGLATVGGYALYLAGVVVVGLGGLHATVGLHRLRRVRAAPT
jgi:hypothetical protein